jgi:phenylalanyl-tRNA synthetase beta chain
MRTMMLPSLLQNIQRNTSRQSNDIRLFEIGKIFHPLASDPLPLENMRVAGVMSGRRHPGSSLLHFGSAAIDFFDCKGIVELILHEVRIADAVKHECLTDRSSVPSYIQPGSFMVFKIGPQTIGHLGKIDGDVLKAFGIRQEVFFFDLDLDALAAQEPAPKTYSQLPKYPSVNWDIALIVSETVASGDLLAAIDNADESLVESAEIFDVYRGQGVAAGQKSVAISLTYRSQEQTLDDKTVNRVHQRLIKMLEEGFHAKLRDAG